jgi:hypothetical protein
MFSSIGSECPNCAEAGVLHINNRYVRCDNCDFERFSTQEELDHYVNGERYKKNPTSERLVTLIEKEPYIPPRSSKPKGMKDFLSKVEFTRFSLIGITTES